MNDYFTISISGDPSKGEVKELNDDFTISTSGDPSKSEVKELNGDFTISISGDPSKSEDWDFVLENKKSTGLQKCRNAGHLEQVKKQQYTLLGLKDDPNHGVLYTWRGNWILKVTQCRANCQN